MMFELSPQHFCTMILYDCKCILNYKEIHALLVAAVLDQALFDRTVLNRFREHKCGKLRVFDAHHSERSQTARIEEIIDAVRLLIDDDP